MAIKQVIVMRRDLKMRRGKEIAQGSHASMAFMSCRIWCNVPFTDIQRAWLYGSFTKVCCRVNSLEELLAVKQAATEADIECHLITDSGRTEFNGVPTPTCLAIGPDYNETINKVTGHLELY